MVPAFIPADAVLTAQAAAAAVPGFVATPEMSIGRTKDSPEAGQEAYNAAAAALAAKNPKKFQDIQDYQDGNAIRDVFVPPREAGPQHHRSAWTPPSGVAKQMEQTVPPIPPYEKTPGHPPDSGAHSEPEPNHHSSSGSSTAHDTDEADRSSSGDVPKPDKGPANSPKTKRSLVPRSLKHKKGPPSPYAYTRYAYLEAHLNAIQNRIQGFVAVTVKLGTMAPLLAEGGIASVLSQGTYLNPNPTENELQEGGKALAQITALAQLFQSLKIFVTIGSDDCKGKGPNGAWLKKDRLSYCSPEGLMMNIIRAHEDKAINSITNADLLKSKYGYTTEYLAKSAWECQKKYGIYTQSAAPPPTNIRSDCVFPIAVCDCTLPDVAALRKKKKSTVVACRKGANLPI